MILCCGEALIDMIPEATNSGAKGFVPHSGGAVFNTAVALGRLGIKTGMLTGLSNDMFGRQLKASLEGSGVGTDLVVASDRPTTLAFVQLSDGHANYTFYDENSAGRMITSADLPMLPDDVSVLFFGGISLACEPSADAYCRLAKHSTSERVMMFDPNIRTGFITDEDRYRKRLATMIGCADIIKVSDEDLDWIQCGSIPMQEKAQVLLDQGASLVIVTQGGDGATGYTKSGKEIHVPAQNVKVADTVGAGDTFNAGIMAKFSQLGRCSKAELAHLPTEILREVLEFAAKVAAVTVSRSGANPPWANEI